MFHYIHFYLFFLHKKKRNGIIFFT